MPPGLEPQVPAAGASYKFYFHYQIDTILAQRLLCRKQSLVTHLTRAFPLNPPSRSNASITINGVLVPVAWNSSGHVTCVAVSTFDEKEYRIAGPEASNQWQDYLNREISVQGLPFQRGMEQWITVQAFRVIQPTPQAEPNKK
jgi:hypothetical protein